MAIQFDLSKLVIAAKESIPDTLLPLEMQLDWFESQEMTGRLIALARAEAAHSGINPLDIHCNVTGAVIGTIRDELSLARLAQSLVGQNDSDEELTDDMMIRCIAASRPGPLWVSVTPARLEKMAFVDPAGVAVYLILRAFDSEIREHRQPNGRNWSSFESMVHIQKRRIQLYNGLSRMNLASLRDLLLALLQVDARVGLANLAAPQLLADSNAIANLDWAIRECLNANGHKSFVATMIRHYQEQLDSYYQETLKLEKQARGNVTTRGMYEWFAREHAPKSATGLVAEVKRAKAKVNDAIVDSVLGDFDLDAFTAPRRAMTIQEFNKARAIAAAKPEMQISAKAPALNRPAKPSFASVAMIGKLTIGVK